LLEGIIEMEQIFAAMQVEKKEERERRISVVGELCSECWLVYFKDFSLF
jgi:hypothetical protein